MRDVVVIGAGLTGLTTSFYLRRAGLDIEVLEEQPRVGGQIGTLQRDGFTYEKGPNTGVLSSVEVVELFEDLGAIDILEQALPQAGCRLIWKGKRFRPLPSGLISAIFTPLFTFGDKLRILFEPMRKRGNNPHESLADMTVRRLGRSFLDYAVDPFLSGIYAGDPRKLVTKYAMPKLYALEQEYGSFIKGSIAKARQPKSERDEKVTKAVFSAKGGLSTLINRLVEGVGKEYITLSAEGVNIKKDGDSWLVKYITNGESREVRAKNVVTTAGAFRLEEILGEQMPHIDLISSLVYAPVVQVSLGIKGCSGDIYNAFGGLVPSKEGRGILGVLFPSSCFEKRAEEGNMLLSVFMGGVNQPDICLRSDSDIMSVVESELHAMLDVLPTQISMTEIFRYPQAIPQYQESQGERMEAIAEIEKLYPGLYIGGAVHGGIGMSDRVKQAVDIAKKVINS